MTKFIDNDGTTDWQVPRGDVVIDQHNSSTPKTDFTQSWVRPVTANATAVSQASMNASIPGKAAGVKGSLYTDVKRL